GGIKAVKDLGLDVLEIEFVRGIYLDEKKANECKEIASKNNIILTVHAPYFINFNSDDLNIVKKSQGFIYQSAKIGWLAGAKCVVFHPGFYGKKTKDETYKTIKTNLQFVIKQIQKENINITFCPETMGRVSQFGTIDEILQLSVDIPNVKPCLDFAHMWARTMAKTTTFSEKCVSEMAKTTTFLENTEKAKEVDGRVFATEILEKIEKTLGKDALKHLHIHMAGVAYNKNGEHNHETLEESKFPWREILDVLKEKEISGTIISESPNIELDAIRMKEYWKKH
ncbi:TIM barrel protein, partial [bacterium]|nr:TIM barrel protein [archaeon]